MSRPERKRGGPPVPMVVLFAEACERLAAGNPRDHAVWQTAFACGRSIGHLEASEGFRWDAPDEAGDAA